MLTAPGLITEFLMWKSVQARRASGFPREARGRSLWFPCGNQSPDVAGWVNSWGKSCRAWLAAAGAPRLGWRENKRLLLPVSVGTDAVVSADTRGW